MVNALPQEKKCVERILNIFKWAIIAPSIIVLMAASVQKHLRFNKTLKNVFALDEKAAPSGRH